MAEKPGDIQREIEGRRRAISTKVDRLTERVSDDMHSVKSEATDRLPMRKDVDEIVNGHPMTSVAVAFGVGALLGGLTPSVTTMGRGAVHGATATAGAAAGTGGVLAGMLSPLLGPLQDEMSRMVRQATAGFSEGSSKNGIHDGRYEKRGGRSPSGRDDDPGY